MKTSRVCFTIVVLASAAFGLAAQDQPLRDAHKLSPSEVKTLIRGASTPEDHLKLAEYFRQEASEEATAARLHEEMAEIYEPMPLPSGFKPESIREMKGHCREFARNADRASAAAQKLAAEHEKLAELMRNAPPQRAVHRR